jgi:hypothetical protein
MPSAPQSGALMIRIIVVQIGSADPWSVASWQPTLPGRSTSTCVIDQHLPATDPG